MKKAVLFLGWLVLAVPCAGEIIIVDDGGYGDFDNIQAAIDYSNNGDIIYVFPGTYTGAGNRDIDFAGRAITVTGVEPQDPYFVAATLIDCEGAGRGFYFHTGEEANSVLAGLTVTNGYADYGGGIRCDNSRPTIGHCVITENSADFRGGGIYCYYSNPIIVDCAIRDNVTTSGSTGGGYGGGGIHCYHSSPKITGCIVTNNSSNTDGGGLYCNGKSPIITNCTISYNTAMGGGGGLAECYGSIRYCLISNNSASMGGGVWRSESVSNCIISSNYAADSGGGVAQCYQLNSCMVVGNSAWQDGGGIYCCPQITNCTIAWNQVDSGFGGGISFACYYTGTVSNSIIWGNTDSNSTVASAQIYYDNIPEVTFSCIQDEDPNDANVPFAGDTNHNTDDNPMFVREPNDGGDGWGDDPCTPGADEGANDDLGDLHLLSGSPCINAGDASGWIAPGSLDIDGEPRVMGLVVDMGADEYFMKILAVTKPQGGEVWAGGSVHEILWISDLYEGNVDVLFSTEDGNNWQTVETNLPDAGNYMWALPVEVDSNECVIAVVPSVPDPNVVTTESGLFTIHPDSPGAPIVSQWKTLGGDYDRKGLSENSGPVLGCIKWEFVVDGAISASVTIGPNDTVYVPCEDGNLYKLDANGAVLWCYEANSPLVSSPSIGPDGTVYVGSKNGKLYAVDVNGNVRWTHSTSGMVYSSPAVSADGNSIYVGSEDGTLYALGRDGSEFWSFETRAFGVIDGAIFASPAIGPNGTVYVSGLYDANLYALDANDGSVKWVCHFDSNGWPFASPVVAPDGTIYQTLLYDPYLYAIDEKDGNILWATNLSELTTEGDPEFETWSYSRWFEPYYHEGGQCDLVVEQFKYRNARYNVGNSGVSEPVIGPDGTIFVSFDDPWLRAVEPNGSIRWVKKPGALSTYTETDGPWGWGWYDTSAATTAGFGLTVDSNSLVFAASDDSNLYVFNTQGFEVARFDSNDYWLGFPVISADNMLIVGDSRDNSMLIDYENNRVWAISTTACGGELDLYWQSGGQDVDGDGKVDNMDLKAVADCWLKCTHCAPDPYFGLCQPVTEHFVAGDINRDYYVNFLDFAALAERWLAGY